MTTTRQSRLSSLIAAGVIAVGMMTALAPAAHDVGTGNPAQLRPGERQLLLHRSFARWAHLLRVLLSRHHYPPESLHVLHRRRVHRDRPRARQSWAAAARTPARPPAGRSAHHQPTPRRKRKLGTYEVGRARVASQGGRRVDSTPRCIVLSKRCSPVGCRALQVSFDEILRRA
jgi:hypothetical protein